MQGSAGSTTGSETPQGLTSRSPGIRTAWARQARPRRSRAGAAAAPWAGGWGVTNEDRSGGIKSRVYFFGVVEACDRGTARSSIRCKRRKIASRANLARGTPRTLHVPCPTGRKDAHGGIKA